MRAPSPCATELQCWKHTESRCRLGILPGVNPEFLYSGEQRCAVDTHACGSAISTANSTFTFSKRTQNFCTLPPSSFVRSSLVPIEGMESLLDNSCNVFLS